MFHSTENTDKGFGGKCFLWIILLYAFGMAWAGIMTCNEEDLWHFTPETWSEACHAAGMSRLVWNARIGELACYFVGGNFRLWVLTLQPLCLVMSVFSIYRLAIGEWPNRLRPTGITLLFITFAILAMHSGLDWFSGNCNWFYPCSIALFFFAIVEHVFYGRFSMPWKKFFLLLPLTVIIGMSNEVVPLVSLCFFGGAGVYRKMRDKAEWGAPYTILLLTLAVSAALFYCAPAGAARFEASDAELSLGSYLQSLSSITSWLYFPICFWRLFLIGIILLLWKPGMNKLLQNRRYLLIIIALCMIWGGLIMAPAWGAPRGYCPMELLFIIILAALFHAKAGKSSRLSSLALLCVHIGIMMTWIWPTSVVTLERHKAWTHIVEAAEQAKQRGEDELIVRDDSDFRKQPVERLWKLPHSLYPYKGEVGCLIIPSTPENMLTYTPYFELTLPNRKAGRENLPLAKRLGLKRVIFIKPKSQDDAK